MVEDGYVIRIADYISLWCNIFFLVELESRALSDAPVNGEESTIFLIAAEALIGYSRLDAPTLGNPFGFELSSKVGVPLEAGGSLLALALVFIFMALFRIDCKFRLISNL